MRSWFGAVIVSVFSVAFAGLAAVPATRPAPRWTQSAAIPAPEANQAAAADDKFLYAIGSAVIAKYDRSTGKRIAVSTGPAHHLNSGFLHDGRLYCAHSNFPKKPESSQVFVLDPETMRLSRYKDFRNFGGSLTWVLWHEGHWWCNFALYDKDNARTFLVQFDDHWQEKARWTYPPELIARLGKWSLSGGVWRDGHLVTTGHDGPELFRLRLPKQGTVLEWVDEQRAPFTGQGIAHDPVTGGLVGVHRGKRQVVLASPHP
jgi:hypothetical protein